jgi:hypothetical protein
MNLRAARLVLVSALFAGWLGYLGFLVLTRPVTAAGWPLVVSRPQVLTSRIDIVADIDDPNGDLVVEEVLWPENAPLKAGDRVKVGRIEECRPMERRAGEPAPKDFSGAGRYLVPLRELAPGKYEVAPIPPSPGFHGANEIIGQIPKEPVRIYPATPESLAQYREVRKPE